MGFSQGVMSTSTNKPECNGNLELLTTDIERQGEQIKMVLRMRPQALNPGPGELETLLALSKQKFNEVYGEGLEALDL